MKLLLLFLVLALSAGCGESGEEVLTKDEVRQGGKADDGRDYCQENGWYSDGICDDFCKNPDPDCREPMTFDEFYERFNGAELGGCGVFELCWYDAATRECTATKPEGHETLDFRIVTEDRTKNAYLAMNRVENLQIERVDDSLHRVFYTETFDKSLPPGPGQDAGYKTRYTLYMEAHGSEIGFFSLLQEDYDPRSRTWGDWFDIRLNWDNPILCER